MNNFVSTRIKAVPSSKAVQQLFHDARLTIPSYLQSTPAAIIHSFQNGGVWRNIDGDHVNDEEYKQRIKTIIMDSVREQQEIYKDKIGRTPQKNGNWIIEGVLTFSAEGIQNTSDDGLMKLAQDAVKQIADELHLKPLYLSMHLDETTRHFHYALENINRDTGLTVARTIRKKKLSKLQDIVGNVFSAIGLQRGKSQLDTNARYVSVTQGHRKVIAELESQKAKAEQESIDALDKLKGVQSEVKALLQEQQALLLKQQELQTSIQKGNNMLDDIKLQYQRMYDSVIRPRDQRKAMLSTFFNTLANAGLQVCQLRWQRADGVWNYNSNQYYKIFLDSQRNTLVDEVSKYQDDREYHINMYSCNPPFHCLDDLKEDQIKRLMVDGLTPNLIVETSPGNHQVWLAFDVNNSDLSVKAGKTWAARQRALIERYNADPNACNCSHCFRVPSFRRMDNRNHITRLVGTASTKRNTIPNWLQQATDTMENKIEEDRHCVLMYKGKQQDMGIIKDVTDGNSLNSEPVPDWFTAKWLRFKSQMIADQTKKYGSYNESEIDYALIKDCVRTANTAENRLRYIAYCYKLLLADVRMDHRKVQHEEEYVKRTVLKSLDSLIDDKVEIAGVELYDDEL